MRHWRGYTVIEVMITLVLIAVATTLAVPSFRLMIDRNHLSAAANDLVSAFLTTRSEAVKRECRISISKNVDWKAGWTAKVPTDIPTGCTALELINHETSSRGLAIATNGGIGDEVIFWPDGRAAGLAGGGSDYFTLTLNGQTRIVCLTQNGRPYVLDGELVGGNCP